MTVIVNCSMKGGTGKTTESIMLANCFAARGKKGCFIDLDTNNSGTMYYMSGIADSFEKQNAFEMFVHRNVMYNLIETRIKNISIVPSSLSLNDVRIEGGALKKALTKDNLDFDFIIIDTAPAYTDVTINALAAADIIFTPIQPQMFNLTTSEYLRTKLVEEFPEQVPKWYLIYSFWRDALANFTTSMQSQISTLFEQRFDNILKDIYIPETPVAAKYLQTEMKLSKDSKVVGEKRLCEVFNKLTDMIFGEEEWRDF